MEYLKTIPQEYFIYGSIGILLLGIILGFTRKITVYRDFADLTKVFMLVLAPVATFILLGNKIEKDIVKNIFWGVEILLLVWIVVSTFKDNGNIFKTLLSLITKIPLGIIFAIYLIDLISPGGKTSGQRKKSRGIAGLVMIVLAPILYGLVENKVWLNNKK